MKKEERIIQYTKIILMILAGIYAVARVERIIHLLENL